jgi:pilus assembly protein Flp/PilA
MVFPFLSNNIRGIVAGGIMDNDFQKLSKFLADESGVTAIEYGLIAGLIALVIIGAVTLLGTNLSSMFGNVAGSI